MPRLSWRILVYAIVFAVGVMVGRLTEVSPQPPSPTQLDNRTRADATLPSKKEDGGTHLAPLHRTPLVQSEPDAKPTAAVSASQPTMKPATTPPSGQAHDKTPSKRNWDKDPPRTIEEFLVYRASLRHYFEGKKVRPGREAEFLAALLKATADYHLEMDRNWERIAPLLDALPPDASEEDLKSIEDEDSRLMVAADKRYHRTIQALVDYYMIPDSPAQDKSDEATSK